MDTNPNEGTHQVKGKSRSKSLVALLVLVVALVLFGAAFVWAGGMDYVTELMGGGAAKPVANVPAKPKPTTPAVTTPSEVPDEFGKRLYLEQIESATNIKKLGAGDIVSFKVTSVTPSADRTMVYITATFKDGTSAPGAIMTKQVDGAWYVFRVTGLRTGDTGGSANTVNPNGQTLLDETISIEAQMQRAGVVTIDTDVVATLLSEQRSNQEIIKGILDGTYDGFTVGAPQAGPGTIALEIQLTGKATAKGSVTLLTKQVDGRDRTFVASFKKQ